MEKIAIWGKQIPGNRGESKLADMRLTRHARPLPTQLNFALALLRKKYKDCQTAYDTYTFRKSIQSGFDKETYEDVPYLAPFPVEGSDKAVIVVPGGGFCFRSSDADGEGNQSEGDLIAKALNEAGISAFVLWYRLNPYRMPVEALDMQRAVRWVRHHAEEYGIDPGKIGAIGFSAGGFAVATHINITAGTDMFPQDYVPDEVDAEDDSLNISAPIYPCVTLRCNETLAYPLFGSEVANDPEKRREFIDRYDSIKHCASKNVPQFLCYGSKDPLLDPTIQKAYVSAVRDLGGDITELELEGAGHGYGACQSSEQKHRHWLDEYVKWANDRFDRAADTSPQNCEATL